VGGNPGRQPHSQTLQQFVKKLPSKKGIEKNLWAKTFIKNILYSPSEISITLYYKIDFPLRDLHRRASGRVGATACLMPAKKNDEPPSFPESSSRVVTHMKSDQTIIIKVPNVIHGSKKKDLGAYSGTCIHSFR
jgi:hypothetical protein